MKFAELFERLDKCGIDSEADTISVCIEPGTPPPVPQSVHSEPKAGPDRLTVVVRA